MNFTDIKHPKQKGEATEAIVTAELLKRGIRCCKPIGDNLPFDLLIYKEEQDVFYKIQCKTARRLKQTKSHAFCFNDASSRLNTKQTYRTNYDGKIDYFMVYYPITDKVYVLNIQNYPTHLRVDECLNKQIKNVSMAKDFELDIHVELFI